MKKKYIAALPLFSMLALPMGAQEKEIPTEESTASVSVISNKDFSHRSSQNIGMSIVGQGLGIFSKEQQAKTSASFTIRGLQSLSGSGVLFLVDGVQRGISEISPEEVESVTILKDAAALAIYGREAANGAILVKTKRGEYNSRHVKVSLDHEYNYLIDKPQFVDAATYANAVNEAFGYEGKSPLYSADEIEAFRSGKYPNYYPNVDWINETFRNHSVTNKYTIEFYGGTQKFRYYTMANLLTDKGFIKSPNENEGYSTQDKYVRGNLRTNMDIELTPTTQLKVNLAGRLMEQSQPGSQANLWSMVYTTPALAFPIRNERGYWGGSATWSGNNNPVAQAQGAGYYKNHSRSLYSDFTLKQDLSAALQGLGAIVKVVYDHKSSLYEDHSKSYQMGMSSVDWVNGVPDESTLTHYTNGEEGTLGDTSKSSGFNRNFQFEGGFNFDRSFGKHQLYTELMWKYKFVDDNDTNSTIYRQTVSSWSHYGYDSKYFVDLALMASATSRLAPGHKWAFSPTVSAAWMISREAFMKDITWINSLKLRASAGIINLDLLPADNWFYYEQSYGTGSGTYPYDNQYSGGTSTTIGRMPTENPTHEKAYKYNIGVDAQLFDGLGITFDAYLQNRKDIWVAGSGKYSSVVGLDVPYTNDGEMKSWGWELGLNYDKTIQDVTLHAGATLNYNRNQIINQNEEPKLYDNLITTGGRYGQVRGLKAIGLLTQDEVDRMSLPTDDPNYIPKQSFGTVRAGDIRYEDVNGDKVVDSNDMVAIGYSTTPEMYYSFNLGAEWKGLGFYALFQGATRYTGTVNTTALYQPLLTKSQLSQYAYDNRWTPENPDSKLPRLSSVSNKNNSQASTWWIKDRSFFKLRNVEVYYNLPESLLKKTNCIGAAKIYLRGNNLFTADHIEMADAEGYSAAQPMTRSFSMGLQVTF